ncbi:hypothetical protein K227x_19400 [Rubripirellula lacrimiformis]|uniref:Uncharacterized protein n=1 Tax=Rubripirellula lacrimiformis TaxID=1930273 RepID=A0A517N8U4_9BACT|nr:hypothetical protein K227x_19400 [Rubripirellula lacrimiformis]
MEGPSRVDETGKGARKGCFHRRDPIPSLASLPIVYANAAVRKDKSSDKRFHLSTDHGGSGGPIGDNHYNRYPSLMNFAPNGGGWGKSRKNAWSDHGEKGSHRRRKKTGAGSANCGADALSALV